MKLLVVLSIKEHQGEVARLLEASGIGVFSVSDITGYKKRSHDNTGWFGLGNGRTNAIALFSFTTSELAENALAAVRQCNLEKENPFPVRAYIINVEQFSDKSIAL